MKGWKFVKVNCARRDSRIVRLEKQRANQALTQIEGQHQTLQREYSRIQNCRETPIPKVIVTLQGSDPRCPALQNASSVARVTCDNTCSGTCGDRTPHCICILLFLAGAIAVAVGSSCHDSPHKKTLRIDARARILRASHGSSSSARLQPLRRDMGNVPREAPSSG